MIASIAAYYYLNTALLFRMTWLVILIFLVRNKEISMLGFY